MTMQRVLEIRPNDIQTRDDWRGSFGNRDWEMVGRALVSYCQRPSLGNQWPQTISRRAFNRWSGVSFDAIHSDALFHVSGDTGDNIALKPKFIAWAFAQQPKAV